MIKLRPHHLLCLIGWEGHGYDQAFTDNFNRIAAAVKTGDSIPIFAGKNENRYTVPGFSVRLVAGNDDICACCPKVETADCREESPAAIDERLLKRLGISADRSLRDRVAQCPDHRESRRPGPGRNLRRLPLAGRRMVRLRS